jgi:AMP-binding enzyme C-terminal domain
MPVLNHPDFPAADLSRLTTVINVGTPERMRYMQDRLPAAVQISCTGSTEGAGFVCLPGVSVVQVVAAPDGHYGEVAAAFVELRPGAALTEEEVVGHCLEQLATFKVPRYVRFVTEWPMSGTKIQKARLRQRITDELAAAAVTEAPRLTRPA